MKIIESHSFWKRQKREKTYRSVTSPKVNFDLLQFCRGPVMQARVKVIMSLLV